MKAATTLVLDDIACGPIALLVHRRWLVTGHCLFAILFAWLTAVTSLNAEDWPTYRHDQQRSGITTEEVDATRLISAGNGSLR